MDGVEHALKLLAEEQQRRRALYDYEHARKHAHLYNDVLERLTRLSVESQERQQRVSGVSGGPEQPEVLRTSEAREAHRARVRAITGHSV